MTARDILDSLHGAGYQIEVAGGKLLVGPASRLSAAQRAEIAGCRDELVALLTADAQHARWVALGDALATAGWEPDWSSPARQQPTVAVEMGGRWWGWEPEAWEAVKAALLATETIRGEDIVKRQRKRKRTKHGKATRTT